jgi:hypothetical protein
MTFSGTTYAGTAKPASEAAAFQVIPDDPDIGGLVGQTISGCTLRADWQGYHCSESSSIAYLVFESLDDDKFDRTVSPIFVMNEATGFNNTLNTYMDHVWDGFYTG